MGEEETLEVYLCDDVMFEELSLHFPGAEVVKQILFFGFSDANPKGRSCFFIYIVGMV